MGRRTAVEVSGGRPALGCDDQPEHPPDRTLRLDRRLPGASPPRRSPAAVDRRRAAHPGRGPGSARRALRGSLAAADTGRAVGRLSLPARADGLQQATTVGVAAAQAADPGPGGRHRPGGSDTTGFRAGGLWSRGTACAPSHRRPTSRLGRSHHVSASRNRPCGARGGPRRPRRGMGHRCTPDAGRSASPIRDGATQPSSSRRRPARTPSPRRRSCGRRRPVGHL